MIQISPHMRVLLATEPVDFRCGIDGLVRLCRERLGEDPFSGAVYVFHNRRRIALKLLAYDGQGFWLCHKRFSSGKLSWRPGTSNSASALALRAHQLSVLIAGGDPMAARGAPDWRPILDPPPS